MMIVSQKNILRTWTQIIYIVRQMNQYLSYDGFKSGRD